MSEGSKQKRHLYNSRFSKVKWFVNRFGARELVLKPLRVTFAPMIISRLRPAEFGFQGGKFPYFYHRYNMTWATERCVEIPLARHYLGQVPDKNVLEVGNVLSHYQAVTHDVLDKFETGPSVINGDILTYAPSKRYDLILSISTFEHIGFDDEAEQSSTLKILAAIESCRKLLSPSGRLIITVPIGYNPEMDEMISTGKLGADAEFFLHRIGHTAWEECSKGAALKCKYRTPFPYGNGVAVAHFTRH